MPIYYVHFPDKGLVKIGHGLDVTSIGPDAHAAYAEFCSAHPYPHAAPSP